MNKHLLTNYCYNDVELYKRFSKEIKCNFQLLLHQLRCCFLIENVKRIVAQMRDKAFRYLLYDNHPYMRLSNDIIKTKDVEFTAYLIERLYQIREFDVEWYLENDGLNW